MKLNLRLKKNEIRKYKNFHSVVAVTRINGEFHQISKVKHLIQR